MPLTGFYKLYPLQRILAPARIVPFGADAARPWPPSAKGLWVQLPPAPLAWQQATSARGLGRTRSSERLTRALDTTE